MERMESLLKNDLLNLPWSYIWPFVYLFLVIYYKKVGIRKFSKNFTARYNLFISLMSLTISAGMVYASIDYWVFKKHNLLSVTCELKEQKGLPDKNMIRFWALMFYYSKYIELFDTFIKIGRKSETSFLHVFHHMYVLPLCYSFAYKDHTIAWWATFINTFVHIIMYYYFYIVIKTGVKPKWGKNLTKFQIIQFFTGWGFAISKYSAMYIWKIPCYDDTFTEILAIIFNCFMTYLFIQFFVQKYKKSKKK